MSDAFAKKQKSRIKIQKEFLTGKIVSENINNYE